eukprot:9812805-Alexandrium_andersonii.AAC.1
MYLYMQFKRGHILGRPAQKHSNYSPRLQQPLFSPAALATQPHSKANADGTTAISIHVSERQQDV